MLSSPTCGQRWRTYTGTDSSGSCCGSQARGDAHPESDVDVLVVLDGNVESGREIRRMGDVRTRIGLRYEQALSLLPVSEEAYRNQSSAWLKNVRTEEGARTTRRDAVAFVERVGRLLRDDS